MAARSSGASALSIRVMFPYGNDMFPTRAAESAGQEAAKQLQTLERNLGAGTFEWPY